MDRVEIEYTGQLVEIGESKGAFCIGDNPCKY